MKYLIIAALAFAAEARYIQQWGAPTTSGFRVIDGVDADIADFPHQVSLLYSGSHTCGSSVLSATSVLTAAHCVEGRVDTSFSVRAGSSNRLSGGSTADVVSYTIHPDYDSNANAFPNDVATVALSGSLPIGGNIQVASLAQGSNTYEGDVCDISGWGRDDQGSNGLPTMLQRRAMRVLNNSQCGTSGINGGHVCIESDDGNGSACNGDSGGPLTCGSTQVGIASWVFGNCITTSPNGYARVSFFYDWIQANL